MAITGRSYLRKGGSKFLHTKMMISWNLGPWSPNLVVAPILKGGTWFERETSHRFSYHAFNLTSCNWIVSSESCACLMLFPRDNVKMHLGDKHQNHQRGTNVTSRMVLYGLWFIYMVYIIFLRYDSNGPNYFFSSSSLSAAEDP